MNWFNSIGIIGLIFAISMVILFTLVIIFGI